MAYGMEIEGNKKIYDFESVLSRKNKGSVKWQQMYQWMPDVADDVVPLTVADMEFRTAPEITKGLQRYLEDNILGYSVPTDRLLSSGHRLATSAGTILTWRRNGS